MDFIPALTEVIAGQLRVVFDPLGPNPPLCKGTCVPPIRRLAGDSIALDSLFDSDGVCGGCGSAFLWIRIVRRFHTIAFPQETQDSKCSSTLAVIVEAGIARCVDVGSAQEPPKPENQEQEFLCLSDDAFRIDKALCRAASIAERDGITLAHVLGGGEGQGPQGGAVTWYQTATFQLEP